MKDEDYNKYIRFDHAAANINDYGSRVSASVAPPNHALIQLLEAALLHPESAEGNIRQVIEALGGVAPAVDDLNLRKDEIALLINYNLERLEKAQSGESARNYRKRVERLREFYEN